MAASEGTTAIDLRARELKPAALGSFLRAWGPFVVCILFAAFLQLGVKPLIGRYLDDFYSKVILDIGTNIILAVSLTVVNGFTGQFSIGHAAFMAVGAYTAADLVYYGSYRIWGDAALQAGILSTMTGRGVGLFQWGDLLFLVSLLAGGLVAAGCGYIVGLPSLRLKGDYLAIVTLGFGEIVRVLLQQTRDVLYDPDEIRQAPVVGVAQLFSPEKWGQLQDGVNLFEAPLWMRTGGALGFSGLPPYASLFWAWLFAGIMLLVAFRLKRSSYGRAFLSIREDEVAAEAMGIHTTKYKVRAFVIAAFFAGIAGGLYAHTLGVQLAPNELGFLKSFDIIIMVVLGGMGSISGAAIAATILTILPELLRRPPSVLHPGMLVVLVIGAVMVGVLAKRKVRGLVVLACVAGAWELVRQLALRYGVNLAEYRMVFYAMALVLMMILRPQGLFGVREVWDLWRGKGAKNLRPPPDRATTGESGRAGAEATL